MSIVRPELMNFTDKPFTIVISGSPGLGKTTLALSAPNPVLFDTDGGIARVKAEHRKLTSSVSSYDELLDDMRSPECQAAESFIIDTGGSLIQLMKPWAQKQDARAAKNGMAMFGVIKTEFDRLCYQIRTEFRKHLILVFHTTEVTKGDVVTTRLSCEGSAKDIVWTPADFGGYMYMSGGNRMIGFTPTEEYFAKGCFGVQGVMQIPTLRPGEPNNFLTNLFKQAQASIEDESKVYEQEREAYNQIMEDGIRILESISDAETANEAVSALGSLTHALTSRRELLALLAKKADEKGLKWEAKGKKYA